jgi:hypothetical protein
MSSTNSALPSDQEDSGNGATKIIIPGRPTQPFFERFHVSPLKIPSTSASVADMIKFTPTFEGDGVEFHTPPVKEIADPTVEPIPGSTLGNSYFDIPTTRKEIREAKEHDADLLSTQPSIAISAETTTNLLIGRRVRKIFPDYGTFEGTIIEADDKFYSVRYDDGDIEDYSANELRSILLDPHNNLSPTDIPEQRHSPRLRKTYMAEIVVDPTEPDQFLHPINPTAYANIVRHNFAPVKYRIAYAAAKVRTSDNPTVTQAKRSGAWPEWRNIGKCLLRSNTRFERFFV